MTRSSRGRAGIAAAVLIAVAATGVMGAGSAAGDEAKRGIGITIKAKLKRGFPIYKGPKTVPAGSSITVLNKTSPATTGPHTFAIVEKDELPATERQRKKCGKAADRKLVCKDIADAHEMNGTNTANVQSVDNGAARHLGRRIRRRRGRRHLVLDDAGRDPYPRRAGDPRKALLPVHRLAEDAGKRQGGRSR